MKKILLTIGILVLIGAHLTTAQVRTFVSSQVGTSPANGYVLQTNGATSTWVATSTLGLALTYGEIAIVGSDGDITYVTATTSTDVGRGVALMVAMSQAVNGDSIHLASTTYDIADNYIDLSLGDIGSVSIYGSGKYNTILKSSNGDGVTPIIKPATNSVTADLSIIGTGGAGVYQYPWGGRTSFTNAILRNVYIAAGSDAIFLQYTGTTTATIQNVTTLVGYDSVNIAPLSGSDQATINIYDSSFNQSSVAYPGYANLLRGVVISESTANIYNTSITNTGSVADNAVGYDVLDEGTSTVRVYGGNISTSGGITSITHLRNQSSVSSFGVTADTVYDVAETSGTITYIDNPQLRYSLGSSGTNGQIFQTDGTKADWVLNTALSTTSAASTYVPYTGATGNVNIGTVNTFTSGPIYTECGDGVNGFIVHDTPDGVDRLKIDCDSGDSTFVGNLSATNLSGTNTGDQNLSGYVPYTGATTAVNLGSQTFTTTGKITGVNASTTNLTASTLLDSDGIIDFPLTTSATVGVITQAGSRYIHSYGGSVSQENIFLGLNAGNFTMNSVARQNVGIGTGALASLSSSASSNQASFNMAVGYASLNSCTTCQSNVGVGVSSLRTITTQADNVGIGDGAYFLSLPTSGVAIGARAARNLGGGSGTATKNVYIGFESNYNGLGSLSNAIAIGADTQSTRSNQAMFGHSSVTETILRGNVSIGTTTPILPTARLDIIGVNGGTTDLLGISTTTSAAGATSRLVTVTKAGLVGIGTSTPTTPLQVTTTDANATSTLTVGKTGQTKGSCLELFDAAGTAVYAYVAAGATTFTLSATSCK